MKKKAWTIYLALGLSICGSFSLFSFTETSEDTKKDGACAVEITSPEDIVYSCGGTGTSCSRGNAKTDCKIE